MALGAALAAVLAWRFVLELELLGWDSYPMIAAGRARGLSELLATFGEELMDGRYPLGHFYRPVAHLAFAWDHAWHGLEPRGYHATDLAILAGSAALVSALVARAFGPGFALGALVAGLGWALHPVHFDVVTAAPRRADALAVLFTLAALTVEAGRSPTSRSGLRSIATALLCALAIGSKETGVVALPVLFAFCLASAGGTSGERLRAALARCWPAVAAVAGMIALRTAVIGGLGGGQRASLAGAFSGAPETALRYARLVVVPAGRVTSLAAANGVLAAAVLLGVVLVIALARRDDPRKARPARLTVGAGGGLVLVWFLVLVVITGLSGIAQGWYQLPFLAPWALACGLLVGAGLRGARRGRPLLGPAAVLLGVALVVLNASAAPPVVSAPEFLQASRLQRAFLERFDAELERAPAGSTLRLDGFPLHYTATRGGRPTRRIHLLSSYSLEAYAELLHPERPLRADLPGRPSSRAPTPGQIRVLLVPENQAGAVSR